MPAGRPPIWSDPQAFDEAVDNYFKKENEPFTWTGLTIFLGFASRDSLHEYGKKPEFSDSVKKGLLRIENQYEKALMKGNPGGPIFALKNFNWRDKQEIDHTSKGESIKDEFDYSKLSERTLREIADLTDQGQDSTK